MNDAMWEVPIGLDGDFEVEVLDHDGDPEAFNGDEPFTASMWQGDDLAPVTGVLSASWTNGDPQAGRFIASVSGAATAAMASDYYLTRVAITVASGRLYSVYDGWLYLSDAPGAATAPTVYCSLQDMLDIGGAWLAPLMQEGGRTSFLAERARATRKLNQVILSRSRPTSYGWNERYFINQFAGPEQPDAYLKGLLDDGKLVVTEDIKEAVAYLAASYVCEKQITWDGDDPHRVRSVVYRQEWQRRVPTLNPVVDVNGDGLNLWPFNLGYMSSR